MVLDTEEGRSGESVVLQNIVTETMEGLNRRIGEFRRAVVTVTDDAVFHLAGCIPSERDEKDIVRRDVRRFEDMRVAASDGEGLPCPGTCIYEIRPVDAVDEFPLFFIRSRG
jgi:hypothetical protein